MLTEALKIVLEVIMKNHIYNFDNEMRRQKEGGAIGMDITGELAKVFMTWWDKQMVQRMRQLDLDPILYKRYVDDINIAVNRVREGIKYSGGALVRETDEEQGTMEKDKRTFEIIKKIGDEIHRSIGLTIDVPSDNDDRKVPILDLKCWMEEVEENGNKTFMLLHEFYMKEVSSKSVIHRDAALSMSSKRTILTQECLRIIKNCHDKIGWEKIAGHLTYFMASMQVAGYDKSFRFQVLKSAIHAYEVKKEDEQRGGVPFHRARDWRRSERRKEKEEKKTSWYKKGGKESVLFVAATPDSELKKQVQEEVDRSGFKIKVVEKSGTRLVRILQRNDPFKPETCRDEQQCMVCRGRTKGACRESGVTYRIKCLGDLLENQDEKCDSFYQGETDRNGYTRGGEHSADLRNHREGSALWKHCVDKHQSVEQVFEMEVTDRVRNDQSKRQLLEAIRIQRADPEKLINSRSEWNSTRVPRLTIDYS